MLGTALPGRRKAIARTMKGVCDSMAADVDMLGIVRKPVLQRQWNGLVNITSEYECQSSTVRGLEISGPQQSLPKMTSVANFSRTLRVGIRCF